jgi:hypothetical protein
MALEALLSVCMRQLSGRRVIEYARRVVCSCTEKVFGKVVRRSWAGAARGVVGCDVVVRDNVC